MYTAEWHHQCNGHELGEIWGDGEGQGSLECCSPWGQKESDTTGRLNNNNTVVESDVSGSHLASLYRLAV